MMLMTQTMQTMTMRHKRATAATASDPSSLQYHSPYQLYESVLQEWMTVKQARYVIATV